MRIIKLAAFLSILIFTSCTSVRVSTDYDTQVKFENYKTFAFYKPGIDRVEISDLDKKRILRAIEIEMVAKGFTKSTSPDLLINISTKTEKNVNVYDVGFGWGPWFGGMGRNILTSTNGILHIDFINSKDKQLVWQGTGIGYLTHNAKKKDERIQTFVSKILEKYPPGSEDK